MIQKNCLALYYDSFVNSSRRLIKLWKKLFDQRGTAHTTGPSWKDITTALNFVVANFSKVFLICDGLDECRNSQNTFELRNIFEFL